MSAEFLVDGSLYGLDGEEDRLFNSELAEYLLGDDNPNFYNGKYHGLDGCLHTSGFISASIHVCNYSGYDYRDTSAGI